MVPYSYTCVRYNGISQNTTYPIVAPTIIVDTSSTLVIEKNAFVVGDVQISDGTLEVKQNLTIVGMLYLLVYCY